ncbi:MarR family transcriptional regulator [Sphaerisporangium melleum]|uniref:MarR family transcriptional regulator n=1 Tax=Sphaerisporangium melleum TaxID=321316 RepID=A0A917R4C9_9ACTN|nr:MarR family winged helix-turn-helix transcriptional regulator [Sphaerisporangium melleum]GGK89812.1 MarR family transcriptional regulator [Sphaerisporangium melleum]GII72544.1 MarR family transcriptional regulator [Sphaerisporangium melleum]
MTGDGGLDEREQRLWRAFGDMRQRLDAAIERRLNSADLSGADFQLLLPLMEAPGRGLRARELRLKVDWDRSRLSHQIRRMEQRGLLAREDCPGDARGTVIRLTADGLAAVRAAAPGYVDTVRRLFVDLLTPDEVEMMLAVSHRVLARLAEEELGPGRSVYVGTVDHSPPPAAEASPSA